LLRLSYSIQGVSSYYAGQEALVVTANDGHNAVNLVWITPMNTGGWSPSCGGCILKRVTSIANNGPDSSTLYNGDEFSTAWNTTRLTCGFGFQCGNAEGDEAWTLTVTRNCTVYPTWGNQPYDGGLRDCRNSLTNTVNNVNVYNFNVDAEQVLIKNWPTPAPAATCPPSGGGRRQVQSIRCIQGGSGSDTTSCDPATQNCNPSACDPANPAAWCYMPAPCDPFSAGSPCYQASQTCDTSDPLGACYEAPPPDPTPTDPPPPPDGGGGCGRPPCRILYGTRRSSHTGEQQSRSSPGATTSARS
jgi:hypothetical protein